MIPMRQLLEVSFLHLVVFGIVFGMFRLFSSSCHQLISTELHFTNKSWLEPTWLGYCCWREFEKNNFAAFGNRQAWAKSHLFAPSELKQAAFVFLDNLSCY